MRSSYFYQTAFVACAVCLMCLVGCTVQTEYKVTSRTGVKEVMPEVATGVDGMTNEQRNIKERLKIDNQPGSIKHLYVLSAMSGDVLIYSTVRGKVTSSGKRLGPTSVNSTDYGESVVQQRPGRLFKLDGRNAYTNELVQDDGTYGSSIEYLYWFDAQGRYHQHYVAGGQVLHLSNEPMPVKKAVLTFEPLEQNEKK